MTFSDSLWLLFLSLQNFSYKIFRLVVVIHSSHNTSVSAWGLSPSELCIEATCFTIELFK